MMYASLEDLSKRYGESVLLSLAGTKERTLDEIKVVEALEDATDTINVYLASRYSLPLNTVPAVLQRHCCYIARYFLEKNRATEQARKDYEDSIKFLEQVSTGKISLGISQEGETVESNNTAQIQSAGSVWARDKSKGFI